MWRRKEFEINEDPAEGEDVQYAVFRVSEFRRHDTHIEAVVITKEVEFFMREPKEK
ncbi:hypothetical protein J7J18_02935 [bacterium]|nr:hypothetical protein [bacterium]